MTDSNGEIKALPSSKEAEEALLGCMIQGGQKEQEIGMAWIRDDNAFYIEDNKQIFKCLKQLYKDNIDVDFITLSSKVQDATGESMAYYITGLSDSTP